MLSYSDTVSGCWDSQGDINFARTRYSVKLYAHFLTLTFYPFLPTRPVVGFWDG